MISVILPAYNEARRLPPSLERIFVYMHSRGEDYEVIVVDDGSSDGTGEAVEARFRQRSQFQVLSYGANRGKGYAVRHGLEHASGDWVLFSDADLSTPIEEVAKMLPLMGQGFDIVIGSRAHMDAEIRERQPLFRELSGKLFNLIVRLVVLGRFHDTQCGFKVFRRESVLPLLPHLRIDGFAFDVEILALAQSSGLRIGEVPVVWVNSPTSRVRLSSALRAFLDLAQIRGRARRLGRRIRADRAAASARAASQPRPGSHGKG
jgi:dolichyl-phosphate beta-glucosyltransferase